MFLEAITTNDKDPQGWFIKLMACLPRRNKRLLGFTLALLFAIAEDLERKTREFADHMRESLAIVLGVDYRKIFKSEHQEASSDDKRWASGNPDHIFQAPPANVTVDDVLPPAELIGRLKSVVEVKQGKVHIGELVEKLESSGKDFSSGVELTRPFLEYVGRWRAPILCRL
jgi:hypothetical protein